MAGKSLIFATLAFLFSMAVNARTLSTEQRLDRKLAKEKVTNVRDLRAEVMRRLNGVVGLDNETRTKIENLLNETYVQQRELAIKQLRLRAVLMKDMMGELDQPEVNLIRERLRSLADKRIDLAIESVTKGNKILGKLAGKHEEILDDLYQPDLVFKPQ